MTALRFAILHHTGWPDHPDHYDLLLQNAEGRDENDRVLKAFATVDDVFPAHGSVFKANDDHRRLYLDYEGPLAQQRGSVRRVDSGTLEWSARCPDLRFVIRGTNISGVCVLKISHSSFYVLEKISGI